MTMSSLQTKPPQKRLAAVLHRYPLTFYFVLAYGFSWLVSLPYILSVWEEAPNSFMAGFMLKQWIGPALAAMVMAWVLGGQPGLRDLRAKGRQWRAP
jgi:hypothetical protein